MSAFIYVRAGDRGLSEGRTPVTAPRDDRERANKHAHDLQESVNAMVGDERDTGALMERLDKMIAELVDVAEGWDSVDAEMAERVRGQERELHELRAKLAHLGELEAEEISKLNSSIMDNLRQIKGDG
jgi:transposase